MTDTETPTRTYPAALLHAVLAEMAWERIRLPLTPLDTRQLLIEHIANMLGILASDAAYGELWERVQKEAANDDANKQ